MRCSRRSTKLALHEDELDKTVNNAVQMKQLSKISLLN